MAGKDSDGAKQPHPRVLRMAGRVSQWSVSMPRAALTLAYRIRRVAGSLMVWAGSVGVSTWQAFWTSIRVWAPGVRRKEVGQHCVDV